MRVGIAQMNCGVGEVTDNTNRLLGFVDQAKHAGCDTVVFPEMSDTGYLMPVILETASFWTEGPVAALREAAHKCGINIVAGVSERTDSTVFNSIVAIDRNGEIVAKYRKTHLITAEPMLEHHHLGSGDELVVGEVDGIKAGFLTCYDIRFPEISRLLTDAGAQILFLPSAFPLVRVGHWKTLTEARAIENQVFVVAANRIGNDGPGLTFCGASRVIDPYGTIIAAASEIDEKLLVADLDLGQIACTRKRLQVHQDRRPDLYARPVRVLHA